VSVANPNSVGTAVGLRRKRLSPTYALEDFEQSPSLERFREMDARAKK